VPRQPRAAFPDAVYHVWARGIEKRALVRGDRDRRDLVERLSRIVPECAALCFAWVFMENHLHFVLRCGEVPLALLMRRLLTGYAVAFNLRHERAGHLFQNRFGSRLVQSEDDLLGVIRYVLRNPLEAGMARDLEALERSEWSALGALVGRRAPHAFESVAEALELLGDSAREARGRLRALVAAEPERAAAGDGQHFDALVREICAEAEVSERDLRTGDRAHDVARARGRVCRRAVAELGWRPAEVARALGVCRSTVSHALRRERAGGEPES
jgi:REP element-mobilizing transposase RayT